MIDDEIMAIFRKYRDTAKGLFVISHALRDLGGALGRATMVNTMEFGMPGPTQLVANLKAHGFVRVPWDFRAR
jgi:hypothetical protein